MGKPSTQETFGDGSAGPDSPLQPGSSEEHPVTIELDLDKPRAQWDSKIQYFFMVISYAVGLGNVWRFPYLCQKYGGGAFLIPYFIMLFIEGMPMLYLEFAAGQNFRQGSMGTWNKIHPFLGGVGVASAVTSFLVGIYYNAVIMWCFFYLFHSFQYPLPWAECPTITEPGTNITTIVEECRIGGPTSYFWYKYTLEISSGLEESGGIKWKLLLCLLFSWLVIYACIWKGIKSSGKVVYVTATFPYLVLIIFFGRGISLRGAADGLLYMFNPDMTKLADPQCWLDAAMQIFFSFGLGFGGLIAFSSYNPKNNNCQFDAFVVSLTNWFTAIFACTVIFSILGFKATLMYEDCMDSNLEKLSMLFPEISSNITHQYYLENYAGISYYENNTALAELGHTHGHFRKCDMTDDLNNAASGTGLAFIAFTQVINEFGPSAPFFSILFFLMLLSLGIGSEFGTLEGVTACIYDLSGKYKILRKKWLVSGVLCLVSCLIGLLFVLGSGTYWVALFDSYAGSFPLITVGLFEAIAISWVYGVERFSQDLEQMIGKPIWIYWKIVWKYVAPIAIAGLLIASTISKMVNKVTYDAYDSELAELKPVEYPWFGSMFALLFALAPIMCIPGVAVYTKLKMAITGKEAQAQTAGHTASTVAFMRTKTDEDEPFPLPEDTSCGIIDGHVTFGLEGSPDLSKKS